MKNIFKIIISTSLILTLNSCNNNSNPVNILLRPSQISIEKIIPERGLPGQKILIIGKRANDSINWSNLSFDNNWYPFDKKKGDSLYFTVPALFTFKELKAEAYSLTVIDSTYHFTNYETECKFTPQPEINDKNPLVVKWNNVEHVSEENMHCHGFSPCNWNATINSDTVILKAFQPANEGGTYQTFVLKDNGADKLPNFISYHYFVAELGEVYADEYLTKGLIKIDRWNTNGVISGTVYPAVGYEDIYPFVNHFYIDFTKQKNFKKF